MASTSWKSPTTTSAPCARSASDRPSRRRTSARTAWPPSRRLLTALRPVGPAAPATRYVPSPMPGFEDSKALRLGFMRTDHVMETPERIAEVYRAEMRRLLDAIDRIPAERLEGPVVGEWTVADVLVHLAAWDRVLAASSDDVLAGRRARLTETRLADINEDVVASRRGQPLSAGRQGRGGARPGALGPPGGGPGARRAAA